VNGVPPTIYDVAATAGVSIASVSRVLNGTGSPRADTRERVLRAVAELGFVPDGAARALSVKLKETVGVVYRRVPKATSAAVFAEEDENPGGAHEFVVAESVSASSNERDRAGQTRRPPMTSSQRC